MTSDPTHAFSPSSVGRYRIRRRIGEGGMGVVFEAEQDNPRRIVALKLIHAGVLSDQAIKRFELETQVLGRLQHPGIARIYEADKFDHPFGVQPFFAMEYIEGETLTEFARKNRLSPSDRLHLIVQICDAVQHAHQRGVIHRDLKPANILVDAMGHPKILDFGLARATDADGAKLKMNSVAGQLLGTLAYMSPEQALGSKDLDARSDIYSLGVLTYELLTEQLPLPLQGVALSDALQIIKEQDPRPLSLLDPAFRGDVETIVRKCLEKQPGRRYPSATALAADIQAHLSEQPISARDPSTFYLVHKFVRRNRALVVGMVSVLIALIIGLVGTSMGFLEARRKARAAELESARASQTAAFLKGLLEGIHPEVAQGRDTSLLKEILHSASVRVESELRDFPRVETEIREVIGESSFVIGDFESAEREFTRAAQLRLLLDGMEAPATLQVRKKLAMAIAGDGRYEEALEMLEPMHRLAREDLGDEHSVTDQIGNQIGILLWSLKRLEESESFLEASLEYRRRHCGSDDSGTLVAMNCLGLLRIDQGRSKEADDLLRETLDRRVKNHGERHPDTIKAFHNLGGLYLSQRRFEDAGPWLERAYKSCREIFGVDHPTTLECMSNLASLYRQEGRFKDAEPLATMALDECKRVLAAHHPKTINAANALAMTYRNQGVHDRSLALHQEILQSCREALGDEHVLVLQSRREIAQDHQGMGKQDLALELFEGLVEPISRILGKDHEEYFSLRHSLGILYMNLGRIAEAEPLMRESVESHRRTLGIQNHDAQMSLLALGLLCEKTQRVEEALALFAEMLEEWVKTPHPGDRTEQIVTEKIADGLKKVRPSRAEPALRVLVSLQRKRLPPEDPALARSLTLLGEARVERGDCEAACQVLEEALDRWSAVDSASHGERISHTLAVYGDALAGDERWEEAERVLLESWEGLSQEDEPLRAKVARSLVQVYTSLGDFKAAENWRQEEE